MTVEDHLVIFALRIKREANLLIVAILLVKSLSVYVEFLDHASHMSNLPLIYYAFMAGCISYLRPSFQSPACEAPAGLCPSQALSLL